MLKIKRETDYALLIMIHLALQDKPVSAIQIAEECSLSPSFVGKILKILTKFDLLSSKRGSQGGYVLNCEPENITILQIVSAIEGPMMISQCVEDKHQCMRSKQCELMPFWYMINQILNREFANVTLKALIERSYNDKDYYPIRNLTR